MNTVQQDVESAEDVLQAQQTCKRMSSDLGCTTKKWSCKWMSMKSNKLLTDHPVKLATHVEIRSEFDYRAGSSATCRMQVPANRWVDVLMTSCIPVEVTRSSLE
jgi:hypothetical protein